jgi:hypothetical protein
VKVSVRRFAIVPSGWEASTTHAIAMRMSIGHSSSACRVPCVIPGGDVTAA